MGKTKALSAGTLALLLHVSVSGTAAAQATGDKAAAEALFQTGRELMTAGKFSEACSKLEASQRLDAGLGTLLYLADCYEKAGRTASAWATFREAESIAEGRSDGARSQIAKDRSAALEPRLSRLWVKVSPDNPDDIQVLRDGALVPRESWGIALPTDSGEHTVTASAPGRKPWSTKVVIKADKETASVDVPALEVAPEEPKPALGVGGTGGDRGIDEHAGRTQRILGVVTAGVGVVGLGFGTFFGLRASSKNDDSKPFCSQNDANFCQQQGKDLRDSAFTAADTATGLFIAGGALLVGGAVIYFTAPSSPAETARAPALRFRRQRFLGARLPGRCVVTLRRVASVAFLAAVLLPSWAACSSILGLEEARLDSTSGTEKDAGPVTLCDRYCASVMANCVSNDRLYFSTKECLATCAVLPAGNEGDDGVNSVQCRLRYADFAGDLGETKDNCPAAGPGGNGVCGSNCDGFCSMTVAACLPILTDLKSNIDADSCDRICGQLPDLGGFAISQDDGDSVQCRIYHASAATLDAKTHCRHVAGIGPCAHLPDGGR